MAIDVVSLDHAIEGFAINRENTCRGLFVSAGVFQHTGNVTSLDYGQRDQVATGSIR